MRGGELLKRAIAAALTATAGVAFAGDDAPTRPRVFSGASVDYLFRSFADLQNIEGVLKRHALTANLRVKLDTGLLKPDAAGAPGLGFDAAPFIGADLASSRNAGNMAHVNTDWHRTGEHMWAYLGEYGVRLQSGGSVLRYGLQQLSNPFLESRDNRGLPPTFRGLAGTGRLGKALRVEAGSVDSMIPRGMSQRLPLSTTYGNTPLRRFDYLGLAYDGATGRSASVYAGHAQDLWSQYFASAATAFGDANAAHVKGALSAYLTQSSGQARQGPIDTCAYSLSLTPAWGPVSATVGFQRIAGEQFFDYLAESWGISLANAYGVDYNAPNERSLLLSLSVEGSGWGWPGFKSTLWRAQGWGANAAQDAQRHTDPADAQHALYWKNGLPVQGTHHELGLYLEHAEPATQPSAVKWKLIVMRHWSGRHYSEDPFHEFKLTMDRRF